MRILNGTPPVDLNHLAIFTEGDKNIEHELFNLFFEEMDLNIEKLQMSCANGDCKSWRSTAHKMKGASANLGARKLSALCFKAEQSFAVNGDMKQECLCLIKEAGEEIRIFFVGHFS